MILLLSWLNWDKDVVLPSPPSPPFWQTLLLSSFSYFKGNCKKSRHGEDEGEHQRHQSWNKLGASVTSIHNDHVGGRRGDGEEESAMENRSHHYHVHTLVWLRCTEPRAGAEGQAKPAAPRRAGCGAGQGAQPLRSRRAARLAAAQCRPPPVEL